ncbi:MAG: hypothetical protein ACREUQ_13930 [Burkholderiales bacterium]
MKMIIMAFGLMVSTAVFGNGLAEMGKTERCELWMGNAMYGATQFIRGASREVEYIPVSTLVEMLEHTGGVGNDKLYILADEGYTEDEREFLEKSTLFGYDAMSKWKSRNASLLPGHDEWQRHFVALCLESTSI